MSPNSPTILVRRYTHSLATGHPFALQIGANGQGTRVELLQLSDGSFKIEPTDVTDNQSPNASVSGDATDDRR